MSLRGTLNERRREQQQTQQSRLDELLRENQKLRAENQRLLSENQEMQSMNRRLHAELVLLNLEPQRLTPSSGGKLVLPEDPLN